MKFRLRATEHKLGNSQQYWVEVPFFFGLFWAKSPGWIIVWGDTPEEAAAEARKAFQLRAEIGKTYEFDDGPNP